MRTLADWLDHQQRQHPQPIALGLERLREVAARLDLTRPAPLVITVGGTNGKGSTVAFLEAMLRAAGYRVGCYTSPHLLRYTERVRVDGREAREAELVAAFERIETARGAVPLTYFEYGTLAALLVFAASGLDVAVLEVGLGGRLDAVNLVDADAAAVTTVDLDHQDWLGNEREAIGREKAGIFRPGRPAIVGDEDPPASLLEAARTLGARLERAGTDFHAVDRGSDGWSWSHRDGTTLDLPQPALAAPCQRANAATALALLHALRARLPCPPAALRQGVGGARARARLERVGVAPEIVVDVAHNPQAARVLAAWLAAHPVAGPVQAVFGALRDKDVGAIVAAVAGAVHGWHLIGLDQQSPRGSAGAELAARVGAATRAPVVVHASIAAALAAARAGAGAPGRVVVFGSFLTAAAALATFEPGAHR